MYCKCITITRWFQHSKCKVPTILTTTSLSTLYYNVLNLDDYEYINEMLLKSYSIKLIFLFNSVIMHSSESLRKCFRWVGKWMQKSFTLFWVAWKLRELTVLTLIFLTSANQVLLLQNSASYTVENKQCLKVVQMNANLKYIPINQGLRNKKAVRCAICVLQQQLSKYDDKWLGILYGWVEIWFIIFVVHNKQILFSIRFWCYDAANKRKLLQ